MCPLPALPLFPTDFSYPPPSRANQQPRQQRPQLKLEPGRNGQDFWVACETVACPVARGTLQRSSLGRELLARRRRGCSRLVRIWDSVRFCRGPSSIVVCGRQVSPIGVTYYQLDFTGGSFLWVPEEDLKTFRSWERMETSWVRSQSVCTSES